MLATLLLLFLFLVFRSLPLLLRDIFLPTPKRRNLHGHCRSKPLPFCPPGISHLGLLPAPSSAFAIFVLVFDPEAHLVPGRIGLLFLQVRHHHQLFFIPFYSKLGVTPLDRRAKTSAKILFTRSERGK